MQGSDILLTLSDFVRWANIEVEQHMVEVKISGKVISVLQLLECFLHHAVQCCEKVGVIAGEGKM